MRQVLAALFALVFAFASPAFGEGVSAIVKYGNGKQFEGLLSTPDEGPIRLYVIKEKRFVRVSLSDLLYVRFEIEEKEMKEAWRWREPGKPDKVMLGKKYPWVKLQAFVRLRDGRLLRCHLTAQLTLTQKDGTERRILIKKYVKGKYGQKFSDLVWVSEILFPDAKPTKPTELEGTIQPEGVVEAVYAVRQVTGEVFRAKLDKGAKTYRFKNLLPGVYDLVVVTEHQVYFGLGVAGEGALGEKLDDEAKKALVDYINSIEEFCEEKYVGRIAGGAADCRVFLRKVRRRKAYGEKKRGEPYLFVEWEFAWLARAGKNWHMVRRSEVFRENFPTRLEKDRLREAVYYPTLSDIDLRRGGGVKKDIRIGGGDK